TAAGKLKAPQDDGHGSWSRHDERGLLARDWRECGRLTASRRKNEDKRSSMHIDDIIREDSPTFSFEFFPPKTAAAAETLYQTILDLESYMTHFISVTYGAGGSTLDLT